MKYQKNWIHTRGFYTPDALFVQIIHMQKIIRTADWARVSSHRIQISRCEKLTFQSCTANICTIRIPVRDRCHVSQARNISSTMADKHYLKNETQMILKLFSCCLFILHPLCQSLNFLCFCRRREEFWSEHFASDCFVFLCRLVILHLVCQGLYTKKKTKNMHCFPQWILLWVGYYIMCSKPNIWELASTLEYWQSGDRTNCFMGVAHPTSLYKSW